MCRALLVSRQGYYAYLESLKKPPRHAALLAGIKAIIEDDEFNDTYGRARIRDALLLRGFDVSLSSVYRVCSKHGLLSKRNKPKGLTKQEKEAYKDDDLLKGDFSADEPSQKLIGDITQLSTKDGPLYISGVFDCFDNACLGLSMDDNMKAQLVVASIRMAVVSNKARGACFHTDRGSQYTSRDFRAVAADLGIRQSMSHAASSCYGNAKCESMWARFKEEAIHGRHETEKMGMEDVKSLVFRYFMGYWNNRRICHAIGGMPPMEKRKRHFDSVAQLAA